MNFSFSRLNNIPLNGYYHPLFIHSSIKEYLGNLYLLAIVNNAAMNIGVQIQVPAFKTFVYIPRSGNVVSNGNSMLNFLRKHNFPQQLYHFTFLPTMWKSSSFSTSTSALLFFIWGTFYDVSLMGMKRHLIMVLICISLMVGDVEKLFMC